MRKIVEREMVAAGVLLDELEAERRALRERQISLRAQKREWAQNALTTGKDAHRISKTIHAGVQNNNILLYIIINILLTLLMTTNYYSAAAATVGIVELGRESVE